MHFPWNDGLSDNIVMTLGCDKKSNVADISRKVMCRGICTLLLIDRLELPWKNKIFSAAFFFSVCSQVLCHFFYKNTFSEII